MGEIKLKFFLTILLVAGCGRDHKPNYEKNPSQRLVEKKQDYCYLSRATVQANGYSVGRCDGLLFTSLRSVSCGDIDVANFEGEPGRWYRNPKHDCFIPGEVGHGADSTISKDMMLGLAYNLWKTKNLAAINRTIDYGVKHSWVMGEAQDDLTTASKCLMSPNLISLYYDIQGKLNGTKLTDGSGDAFGINTGFRAHLDVISILLSGSVRGAITSGELATLKAQAERQPRNALFQAAYSRYTDGNQGKAEAILLNEAMFPHQKLPTTDNHCSDYLWSDDDEPKDWAPCPDRKETWEGFDLIVAAAVADGTL